MLTLSQIANLIKTNQTRADVDSTSKTNPVLKQYKPESSRGIKLTLDYQEDLTTGDVRITQY
jgi:hypothetical protein